jgi:hypothetical protein
VRALGKTAKSIQCQRFRKRFLWAQSNLKHPIKQTTKQTSSKPPSKAGSKPQARFSKNKNFNIVTMGEVISDGELESLW